MAKRRFRLEDAFRLKAATEAALSADGKRVAFVLAEADEEADRLSSSIWVVPTDGSAPPRRFTEGPADRSPRWSPDGRWLAYISVTDNRRQHAHVRLAPLDGGMPARLGDLPGPGGPLAWSPDSRRIAAVVRVGLPDPEQQSARERNAGRVTRGLAARFDGVGWKDGRRHVFLVDVQDGSAVQLTRGDYDHGDPAFSPDGAVLAFTSDRHSRRNDRTIRADVWVVPVVGGRPRRLTDGTLRAAFPLFSPGGEKVAFVGQQDADSWDTDRHVFVVPADGSEAAREVAPGTDRPVPIVPGLPAPMGWIGPSELAILLADRGRVVLHRARIGDRRSREIAGGELQIDAFSVYRGTVAFTAGWLDQPSELYVGAIGGQQPVQLTHLNDDFLGEVELAPLARSSITRPDGTEVEYFTMLPPDRARGRLPLHLDIHGGPHAWWPSANRLAQHQSIAAAGYALVLPNPRGSSGYGQQFTAACTGDWGGGDYEDILACCDDLIERGVADAGRMFVTGGSYGGFMTGWIVGHTGRFRAATAVAAVTDQTSMALTSDIPDFSVFNMGGTLWDRPGEYERLSPLRYAPAINTPVLLIHWEGDLRVPIGQAEELYNGLRLLGKEAELVRYPGGFHTVRTPSQAVDWTRRTLDWNDQHDSRRRTTSRRETSRRGRGRGRN
jgi:dipeptidyl aminopeptidase/acylaminoacyl peptidase